MAPWFSPLSSSRFLCSRVSQWSKGAATFRFLHAQNQQSPSRKRIAMASGIVFVSSVAIFTNQHSGIHADHTSDTNGDKHHVARPAPLSSLLRSYLVYSMCSMPILIDWSPSILSVLSSIPGVKQVTGAFIRHTFFSQFVGGETARECLPLIEQLRAENKGCLFAYSIEVDESEASGDSTLKSGRIPVHKRIVQEMIQSVDVAADFEDKFPSSEGRRTWIAVKMTALVPDSRSLVNLSKYILRSRPQLPSAVPFPGCPTSTDLAILESSEIPAELTPDDVAALKELHSDLFRICTRAKERGVRVVIDAEYSWYQPAIDAFTLSLSRRFNELVPSEFAPNVQPLVYGTYQAYLRRTPMHLKQSFQDARAGNYALGVKLVRGAYHEHEIAAHSFSRRQDTLSISAEQSPPVFLTKADTDDCYNSCAKILIQNIKQDIVRADNVPHSGIMFGTHNPYSCQIILDELVSEGLAIKDGADDVLYLEDNVLERLTFAQLLGMKDDLTDYLASRTKSRNHPVVMKYVPYGALSEVMPYLSRRAIENKSVLGNGGAADERRRVGTEIRRRVFGFWN